MEKFDNGAVWFGCWHTGLKSGHFGSPGNPHYALKLGKTQKTGSLNIIVPFFPFTSKKSKKCILELPPGELNCGRQDAVSYLMPFRLLILKHKLEKKYTHKSFLSEARCQEALRNYKEILNARKMK